MKKIVFINSSTIGYGLDYSLISIILYLKKSKIDCEVILPGEGRTAELLRENNIKYMCIPFYLWKYNKGGKFFSFLKRVYKEMGNRLLLFKYIKKIKSGGEISLVYSNSFTNKFSYLLAKKLKVPHIQHIREFGEKDFNWKFDVGFEKTIKYASENSSMLVCISDAIKKIYEPYCKKDNIIRIYNGISVPKLSNISKINDTKYIKLIIIGRLSKEKGHMHLLEAINIVYKKYKNIILDIYGDGVEKESLIKFVNDNNLNNVVFFKGYKSNIEIDKYDIGLMCSKSEGFGRVTVEYMMNGLAVIGTDSGANPEIIVDNETGLLYKFGNYESLSLKILFLINNVNVLRKYGKLGRKRAIKYFSEETYNKNIYDLCNRIIDGENNEQC